jgi:hypothetical protein
LQVDLRKFREFFPLIPDPLKNRVTDAFIPGPSPGAAHRQRLLPPKQAAALRRCFNRHPTGAIF